MGIPLSQARHRDRQRAARPGEQPSIREPTYLRLLSADVDHSFWVPQLAGKTDLIPNHPNEMWMDPQQPGVYLGQCAQFCGMEHAKMLIRVYVDTPEQFAAWVQEPAAAGGRRMHAWPRAGTSLKPRPA